MIGLFLVTLHAVACWIIAVVVLASNEDSGENRGQQDLVRLGYGVMILFAPIVVPFAVAGMFLYASLCCLGSLPKMLRGK